MLTQFLTDQEKKIGQKKVYSFQAMNGLGFNFMGETPVYLMAIHFGASNIELGYISSVIFITGFILVILPRLLAGKNLIKVQSTAWILRGFIVLLYLLLYFLEGKKAVLLILVVYTLFCSARVVGVVIWNPLVRMVTNSSNRGTVLAQGNISNQSASVISKLFSFILTSFKFMSGITGLLLLQIIGFIFNTLASLQLRQIPCRENVEYQKSDNLFKIFTRAIKDNKRRYPLLIKWISISVIILNGLTIVFLRKEAGFTANYIFLYTMVIALANILSGIFAKTFADRLGSRPLLIGVNIFLALFLIIWMLLPVNSGQFLPRYLFFILGFFSNFFLLSNNVLVDRVVVNTMPDKDSFGYNSMINFIIAFFSLFTGILGGLFIDAGQNTQLIIPNNYSILFFFAFLLTLVLIFLCLKIIDNGSLSAKETAAILFSMEGLKAFSYIGKLNTIDDPVKKKTVLLSMSQNNSNLATEEMRTILASPLSPLKGEVIKSLFDNPRLDLLEDIIKEASDIGSYQQIKAIFTLGAYPDERVEKLLVKLLDNPETSIRSNAAKSLGRIGHTESLNKVKKLSLEAYTAWDRINYLIALKNMDIQGEIYKEIFNIPDNLKDGIYRQTYYSLVADLFDFEPKLSEIYSSKTHKKGDGLKSFLEQTRDIAYFNNSHDVLLNYFKEEKWDTIWNFCFLALDKTVPIEKEEPLNNLALSIITESKKKNTLYDDALAALFFTYQILISIK